MAKGKKTGGRGKSTPNKKTLVLIDELDDLNVVQEYKDLLIKAKEKEDWQLVQQILSTLIKFIYPQRKAVEMTADVDMPIISIKGL